MKKILLLLAFIFSLFVAKAEITNIQTYVDGTNVEIYWQGDTTLSKVYEVGILEPTQYNYISYIPALVTAFAVTDGWYGITTDLILKFGYNYKDYEGTASAEYFPKEDWDASVDSLSTGLTLKPGTYIVYVEGYDAAYKNTTEDYVLKEIQIEDTTTAIGEVKSVKAIKCVKDNKLFIVTENGTYNVLGLKVD